MKVKKQRRKYTATFKSKVVLEALEKGASQAELARHYNIHPNQIVAWKKSLKEKGHLLFAEPHPEKDARDRLIESLQKKNDRLTADIDFLKKKLAPYL
jgi:transposase-like protein